MRVSPEYLNMLQNRIDIVANNLANAGTTGFKEGLLSIEESFDRQARSTTVAQYGGVMPGMEGVEVQNANLYLGRRTDFSQGSLVETGNPWDMAINGEGFFQVRTADGKTGYTRAGVFSLDAAGNLVNNQGMFLEPPIQIPADVTGVSLRSDGMVVGLPVEESEDDSGSDEFDSDFDFDFDFGDFDFGDFEGTETETEDPRIEIGQISLFRFENPDGLEQYGQNIYLATEASGEAIEGISGTEGVGEIKTGMLERSNSDLVKAMTNMIEAQRAYQFDLRVIQHQDEMMQQTIAVRG